MDYIRLMRLDKPIGILLLLWPTLWALWLASRGPPPLKFLLVFVLGTVLTRTAGCVVNDITDHHIDGWVERTRDRPLVTGQIRVKTAWRLVGFLLLSSACLLFFLNNYARLLAGVAVLLMMIYPWLKRITHWPQAWLGLAFAWGIPMSFAAIQNYIPAQAWILFFITFLWVIAYDTLYAMVDRRDDSVVGVKSTAVLLGRWDKVFVGVLQVMVVLLLLSLGAFLHFSFFYSLCVSVAGLFFVYQQWLIRKRARAACFRAFLNNNGVGFWVFCGFVLA